MKFLFFTLTAFLSFGSLKSTAQDVTVSAAVMNSFTASFKNASAVQWKDAGSYYKADFEMEGQYVAAFYNTDGKLMAVTKNIATTQLPVTLQAGLKVSYEDFWVSELFEVSDENGTSYYVTVEDGDSKIVLKSYGSSWTTFKKSRKS